MNNVVIMGRITKDIELRSTNTGVRVVNFCVAVRRAFSKNDETDFIECTAWDKTADILSRFFRKGSWIAVRGDLRTQMKERSGVKYKDCYVNVIEVGFVGDKNSNITVQPPTSDPYHQQQSNADFDEIGNDDELPF